ncbi:MAG: hypothetical protein AAB550_01170 [Patescibacteria group bacterium]|mgnify:CR=1 FL=1
MGRILVIINLVLLNLGLGWLFYKSQIPVVAPTSTNSIEYVDQCGEECKKYIDSKIIIPTPSTFIKTVYQTTPKTKTRSVVYIPIPGSGFTTNNTWSDLPGTDFYFNKSDYLGIIDVAFEANLRLFNGNGTAYVQIFDVTHGVGVQGSDISTSSQTSTAVISGSVSFWAGKNLYRIQAKSLTADTAMFDGGRLKVTLEQ